mgnify:CR=1 FL=1
MLNAAKAEIFRQFPDMVYYDPWLDESVASMSALLAGETISSATEEHYRFHDLEHHPLPFRGAGSLPIMIGGGGEKKTLRTVAT